VRIFIVLLEANKEKVSSGQWFECKDEHAEEIKAILKREGYDK
jgi:hypothetical protein